MYVLFQGTVDRLIGRALLAVDFISESFKKEEILPVISVLFTIVLIGAVGYGMSYLMYVFFSNFLLFLRLNDNFSQNFQKD